MIVRKAFKFRLNTTPEIEQKLFEFSGCCRFVWNKALAANLYRLENKRPIMRYNETAYWLSLWKKSDDYGFLSHCHSKKYSNNWSKLQAKVAKLHEKIVNARHDPLHKIPTKISENQALIVVEDLKVSNMTKHSKAKQDANGNYLPNKQAQKSGLNKAILDQGWSM